MSKATKAKETALATGETKKKKKKQTPPEGTRSLEVRAREIPDGLVDALSKFLNRVRWFQIFLLDSTGLLEANLTEERRQEARDELQKEATLLHKELNALRERDDFNEVKAMIYALILTGARPQDVWAALTSTKKKWNSLFSELDKLIKKTVGEIEARKKVEDELSALATTPRHSGEMPNTPKDKSIPPLERRLELLRVARAQFEKLSREAEINKELKGANQAQRAALETELGDLAPYLRPLANLLPYFDGLKSREIKLVVGEACQKIFGFLQLQIDTASAIFQSKEKAWRQAHESEDFARFLKFCSKHDKVIAKIPNKGREIWRDYPLREIFAEFKEDVPEGTKDMSFDQLMPYEPFAWFHKNRGIYLGMKKGVKGIPSLCLISEDHPVYVTIPGERTAKDAYDVTLNGNATGGTLTFSLPFSERIFTVPFVSLRALTVNPEGSEEYPYLYASLEASNGDGEVTQEARLAGLRIRPANNGKRLYFDFAVQVKLRNRHIKWVTSLKQYLFPPNPRFAVFSLLPDGGLLARAWEGEMTDGGFNHIATGQLRRKVACFSPPDVTVKSNDGKRRKVTRNERRTLLAILAKHGEVQFLDRCTVQGADETTLEELKAYLANVHDIKNGRVEPDSHKTLYYDLEKILRVDAELKSNIKKLDEVKQEIKELLEQRKKPEGLTEAEKEQFYSLRRERRTLIRHIKARRSALLRLKGDRVKMLANLAARFCLKPKDGVLPVHAVVIPQIKDKGGMPARSKGKLAAEQNNILFHARWAQVFEKLVDLCFLLGIYVIRVPLTNCDKVCPKCGMPLTPFVVADGKPKFEKRKNSRRPCQLGCANHKCGFLQNSAPFVVAENMLQVAREGGVTKRSDGLKPAVRRSAFLEKRKARRRQ